MIKIRYPKEKYYHFSRASSRLQGPEEDDWFMDIKPVRMLAAQNRNLVKRRAAFAQQNGPAVS